MIQHKLTHRLETSVVDYQCRLADKKVTEVQDERKCLRIMTFSANLGSLVRNFAILQQNTSWIVYRHFLVEYKNRYLVQKSTVNNDWYANG